MIKADFTDPRVQEVYRILCDADLVVPSGEHWEGRAARLIVDALFPGKHLTAASVASTAIQQERDRVTFSLLKVAGTYAASSETAAALRQFADDLIQSSVTVPQLLRAVGVHVDG